MPSAAYTRKTWVDVPDEANPPPGAVATSATEFNRMEGGIEDSHERLDTHDTTISTAQNKANAALVSVDGVSNPGGNIDLVAGTNVTITPNDAANTITIASSGGGSSGLGSIDGVSNTGGNVDLIPGANVTITPDDTANTITIASSGGASGYATVQEEGVALTQRSTINFVGGGITATDDSGSGKTAVSLLTDAAAATPSARTLGTGATQALPGNHSSTTDTRVPTDASVTAAKEATSVSFVEIVADVTALNALTTPKKGKVVFVTSLNSWFGNYGTSGTPLWRHLGPPETIPFSKTSTSTGSFAVPFYTRRAITIVGYYITIGTLITGGPLVVDLDRATSPTGTFVSLYTTTANRPTLSSTTARYANAGGLPNTVDIPADQLLLPRIDTAPTGGGGVGAFLEYVVRP